MNNKIGREIIKTEDFFVGKKHEKSMFILNKTEFVFNSVANYIELTHFRTIRSQKQREERTLKRKTSPYYRFAITSKEIEIELLDKADIPSSLELKIGEYFLKDDYTGIFRGPKRDLLKFIEGVYNI